MNNELYILNKFYGNEFLIIHKGAPYIFQSNITKAIYFAFEKGDILEFSGDNHISKLRDKQGYIISAMNNISINQPFQIIKKFFVYHKKFTTRIEPIPIELIQIKYLTQLELFDIIYK